MKLTSKFTIPILICFSLAASVSAQETGQRAQFQAAVAAFQKSATEDNARKLAELAKQLQPLPAVPEEAEFHALKGAAFVKQAGDAAAFAKAAGEFQAAIAIAPWVGEYHFNLAVCEKSAGRFPSALAALKLAQIFARDDQARHDCLVLRADLEAAQELATARKAEEQKAAARPSGPDFSGSWMEHTGEKNQEVIHFTIEKNGDNWIVRNSAGNPDNVIKAQGRHIWLETVTAAMTFHTEFILSEDSRTIDEIGHASQSPSQLKNKEGYRLTDPNYIRHNTLFRK